MGEIGIPELLIILAIIVILFGPSRIAGLGKSLGQGIREFRSGIRDGDAREGEPQGAGVSPSTMLPKAETHANNNVAGIPTQEPKATQDRHLEYAYSCASCPAW